MWSDKYNPMVCFDALMSSSEKLGLENLEVLGSSLSESRIEFPEGGFIELPGIESPPQHNEHMFHSNSYHYYSLLDEPTSSPANQINVVSDSRFLRRQNRATPFTKIRSLEFKLVEKDQIIAQQKSESIRLREHLNRLMQIVTDRNLELHNLRNEASGAIRELNTWNTELRTEVKCLRDEVTKKESVCNEMASEVNLVPLLRGMLDKGRQERQNLLDNVSRLEKSFKDLTTKNNILEHELTVIPRMVSKVSSKKVVKAEVHSPQSLADCALVSSGQRDWVPVSGLYKTVNEQKTTKRDTENPEEIVVLQSEVITIPENDDTKRVKKDLSLKKWFRRKTSKAQKRQQANSLDMLERVLMN